LTDIQVSVEAGPGLERRVRIQVPANRVEREFETRLKSVGTTARLKGFRPGKVPVHVVRQRFGPQIRQEVLQEVIRSSSAEAITREKLRPAGTPKLELGDAAPGQDITYTAVFEVYPEFTVTGVTTLAVERPEVTVADADIDQTIDRLRAQRASWIAVQRGAARGDRVVIDFNGTRGGQPIPGGAASRIPVVIGEGRMLPDFESSLVGLSAGQKKSFPVRFPADYHEASLREATVEFEVEVHEVGERKLPEVDAEFVRGFDIASGDLAEFRRLVRENLEREAAAKIQAELRRQILDGLLKANPVDVPKALVDQEAAGLQSDAMRSLGVKDVKDAPPLSEYEEVARRRARLALIMAGLVAEHGLKVDPAQVNRKVDALCQSYERPDEVRKLYLQSAELMSQIENAVMEEQLMAWLIERVRVTPRTVTFSALMGV
jgi:trigger factor